MNRGQNKHKKDSNSSDNFNKKPKKKSWFFRILDEVIYFIFH